MPLHRQLGLTRVINAAGSFTPLGVSRSSAAVAQAASGALQEFFVMDELQALAGTAVARHTGAEAAAVVHCAAAGITLAVAATITGSDPYRVAALPDAGGLHSGVVIPAGHLVDYGHPIAQDVRLAGASVVAAGSAESCPPAALHRALDQPATACLLLVSSRLVRGAPVDFTEAVQAAHARGLPVIIDGAAQDLRMHELLATGADLLVISAQKYLAAPTCGVVLGRADLVAAVRAQEKGIGRAMKASKEAIVGLLAALQEREKLDLAQWRAEQQSKIHMFMDALQSMKGVCVSEEADPVGMPFSRVCLRPDAEVTGMDASRLADELRQGDPSVWAMTHRLGDGVIVLELVALSEHEVALVAERLASLMTSAGRRTLG